MSFRTPWTLCLAFALALPLLAQESLSPASVTVEWMNRGGPRPYYPNFLTQWTAAGQLLVVSPVGIESIEPETQARTTLFSADWLKESFGKTVGTPPELAPLPDDWSEDGSVALFSYDDDLWSLRVATKELRRLTANADEEVSPRISPRGRRVAFVRRSNLFYVDTTTGKEMQLTFDGTDTVKNGTLSWVYWEEVYGRNDLAVFWSEDEERLAYLRTDESMVSEVVHLHFEPAVPEVIKQRYPKAGSANPVVRLGMLDLREERPVPVWPSFGRNDHEYLVRVKWNPWKDEVWVQTLDRRHRVLDLWRVPGGEATATKILTETDPAWVNVNDDLDFLSNGEFLWASERGGTSQLYRYAADGKLLGAVTSGPEPMHAANPVFWLRRAVQGIDESKGTVFFGTLRPGVMDTQLWKVQLDGSGQSAVTPEPGTHEISMNRQGTFFVDNHSTLGTPPSMKLRRASGEVVMELFAPKNELAAKQELVLPTAITVPARDGFPMPGWVFKPRDFDPKKTYPLILFTYGGPSSRSATNAWRRDTFWNTALCRAGFIVACVDNRSATGADKAAENSIAGRMTGDGELADMLDIVKWWKAQPYIDPARVGIWGWSNGGMMTLLMMTRSQEFKAGISVAPVTDWHYYDTIWAENTNGLPSENAEGYESTNLWKRAKDLSGRLLLVHGTYDDNVHIQNTWHFVHELVNANKLFELMIYPMRQHGIADSPARVHLYSTMMEFWKRNL